MPLLPSLPAGHWLNRLRFSTHNPLAIPLPQIPPRKTFLDPIVHLAIDPSWPSHRHADAVSSGDPGNGQETVE